MFLHGKNLSFSDRTENQLIIAGFRVKFFLYDNAGNFRDDQFTGGVYETAGTQMAADGSQILPGQGNVNVTPGFADGAVETDNFTVPVHLADGDATGVPDPGRQQTAHTGENHAAGDMLFPAKGFDGFHQVVAPAQPDTVEA
jgi:hypothetical protein